VRQGTESGGAGNRFTDIADRAAGRQEVLDVNAGLMLSVRGYPLPPRPGQVLPELARVIRSETVAPTESEEK